MKTAIWGAGQAGIMAKNMLPEDHNLICFIDADKNKQKNRVLGIPVLSLEDALKLNPDKIFIAVLNSEAVNDIKSEIKKSEFDGEIIDVGIFRENQDLRLASIRLIANQIKERGVEGGIAELGVYKGDTAAVLNSLFPERKLYLFDTFSGFDLRDLEREDRILKDASQRNRQDFSDTSVKAVLNKLPHPKNAVICEGYFPESLSNVELPDSFAFVSLDPDLYQPAFNGLSIFYPLLSKGGVIHIHDYNSLQYSGVKAAADEFCIKNDLFVMPIADFHGSAVLIKQ